MHLCAACIQSPLVHAVEIIDVEPEARISSWVIRGFWCLWLDREQVKAIGIPCAELEGRDRFNELGTEHFRVKRNGLGDPIGVNRRLNWAWAGSGTGLPFSRYSSRVAVILVSVCVRSARR